MNDADIDQLGPIDYLVVEFPADREPDGSACRCWSISSPSKPLDA